MTNLILRQMENAEDLAARVRTLFLSDASSPTYPQAVATLTAGILIAAQLENLAGNVDCDKIAAAIRRLEPDEP